MKNSITICFMLLIALGAMFSCSKDDKDPSVEINKVTFNFKSTGISDLKMIRGADIQDLPIEEAPDYFGKRVEFAQPQKLLLGSDSLFICFKERMESYRMKVNESRIEILIPETQVWMLVAEKTDNGGLLLNTEFYRIKSGNEQRTLITHYREYSKDFYNEMPGLSTKSSADDLVQIRMSVKYLFEK